MGQVRGSLGASSGAKTDNRARAETSSTADERQPGHVAFYDASYGNIDEGVQAAVRRGAFGEDIGQNGWLTADEWRRYLDWLGVSDSSDLLDVASGGGGPAVWAAVETGCRVVGVDIHPQGVEAGNRRAGEHGVADRARFVSADAAQRLPFPDASFDVVTCVDAINHLPDRVAVLSEWRRVLRPGGQLLYSDPIMPTGILSNHEIAVRASIGLFHFTPVGVNERLLAAAGFELIRIHDATENTHTVARSWHQARARHRDELLALEGEATFEGQQRFLETASRLAGERRLSRFTFHARTSAAVDT